MNELLENEYFEWLCAKVVNLRTAGPDLHLLRKLHNTEFIFRLVGDDNRLEEGRALRREFLLSNPDIPDDEQWRTDPRCSVLEMMIAFARRCEIETEEPAVNWFWEFIDNLRLKNKNKREFGEAMHHFLWRTYDASGYGGMFPLANPQSDQREVDIWYQFNDYLVDQGRLP
jgi:hypothetical protein